MSCWNVDSNVQEKQTTETESHKDINEDLNINVVGNLTVTTKSKHATPVQTIKQSDRETEKSFDSDAEDVDGAEIIFFTMTTKTDDDNVEGG